MTLFIEYLVYAAAFAAVVLLVEGLAQILRSFSSDERKIGQRLSKLRERHGARPDGKTSVGRRLSAALVARFPRLDAAMRRADAPFSPVQLVAGAVGLLALVALGLSIAGAPPAIAWAAGLALGVAAPWLLIVSLAARRRSRFLAQLPQAVDLMARSLQAGHPVTTAMGVVGERMPAPLGPEFRLVIEEMTYGLDRSEAMQNLLQRFPLPELRMFTASLEVTRESGGNLAEVFLKLAGAIRAKDQLRRKVHAISAEGRLTFWVVSFLPFAVALVIMLMQPSFFLDVLSDPLFWPMMMFAPITLAIGATMIWRMVNVRI